MVTKKVLKSGGNNQPIQEDQLVITLAQMKGTIYCQLLTSISDDTNNLTLLTQNHFQYQDHI